MQVHNSIHCSGGPQQITSVQVDNNDLRKSVCSLNLRQRKAINIVSLGQKQIETNKFSPGPPEVLSY